MKALLEIVEIKVNDVVTASNDYVPGDNEGGDQEL